MNLEQYIIPAILIFLLYYAVRSGIHHHRAGGFTIGIILAISGIVINGTAGTLLILAGISLFVITLVEPSGDEQNE